MSANVEDIFLAAVEKAGAKRAIYLDQACQGDEELRKQVEMLLSAHMDAGSFLEQPADGIELQATILHDGSKQDTEDDPTLIDSLSSDAALLEILESSDDPESLGRIGNYEIHEVVGQGGMGIVLKGLDSKLNRIVAIKVLSPELASNAMARKRFFREAQAAAAVSHDHVVTIHAIDGEDRLPHLVMEFISGQSLQQRIDRDGPLDTREILRIGKQTAAGLAAAHAEGLIHRDIKPANILLENGIERVKITDFGLARAVDDVSITQTGVVAGTPQYMSPEQAQGLHVDPRSDLFSLGCVLYAMCTGRPPFRADSTIAIIRRVCDDTARPIREVNPDIPVWLAATIDRLLEKDPEKRLQSAREVAELLGKYLAHLQDPSSISQPVLPQLKTETGARDATVNSAGISQGGIRKTWPKVAAAVLILSALALGITEATDVTNLSGTIIHIFTPGQGTLIVEVDDPTATVTVDGEEIVLTASGFKELHLKPGEHGVLVSRPGEKPVRKLVQVIRDGQTAIVISQEGIRTVAVDQYYPTLSPFEAVRWNGLNPEVKLKGSWHKLVSINKVSAADIVRFAIEQHEEKWQKRFEEDLVQVMGEMGKRPGRTVNLKLADLDGRGERTLANIEMTEANRRAIWEARKDRETRRIVPNSDQFGGNWTDLLDTPKLALKAANSPLHSLEDGALVLTAAPDQANNAEFASSWKGRDARMRVRARCLLPHRLFNLVWRHQGGTPRQVELKLVWKPKDEGAASFWLEQVDQHYNTMNTSETKLARIRVDEEFTVELEVQNGHATARIGDVTVSMADAVDASRDVLPSLSVSRSTWKITEWQVQEIGPIEDAEGETGSAQPIPEIHIESESYEGHNLYVQDLAVSPDGKRAASVEMASNLVSVWEIATRRELHQFKMNDENARSVAFSPDGRFLLTGGSHGECLLWNLDSGEKVRGFEGHRGAILNLAFSPDGGKAVTVSGQWWKPEGDEKPDNTIRIWNVETGEPIRLISDHEDLVTSVAFLPNGKTFVTGSRDQTARLWDLETGEEVMRLIPTGTEVFCVAVSPDGRLVAAGTGPAEDGIKGREIEDPHNCQVCLFDLETGQLVRRLKGHTGCINEVNFSPDGTFLLSGSGGQHVGKALPDGTAKTSQDNTLRIWDVATGRELCRFRQTKTVYAAAFLPKGRSLLAGAYGAVRLWTIPKGVSSDDKTEDNRISEIRRFEGHTTKVFGVRFAMNGQVAVSASGDNTVRIWDVKTAEEFQKFADHKSSVYGLAVSVDGQTLATGDSNGNVVVRELPTGNVLSSFKTKGAAVSLAFSPTDPLLACGTRNDQLLIWNLDTKETIQEIPLSERFSADASFSPDGKLLAAGDGGLLRIWETSNWQQVQSESSPKASMNSIAWRSDSNVLAWGTSAGLIRLLDVESKQLIRDLTGHTDSVVGVHFGRDERQLISTSRDRSIRIWDFETGEELARHTVGTHCVQHSDLSADGVTLLTGGGEHLVIENGARSYPGDGDYELRLWKLPEIARPKPEAAQDGRLPTDHLEPIISVAVSRDGRYLLSGSYDDTARLFDISLGRESRALLGHEKAIEAVAFSPDSKRAVTAGSDSTLRLWNVGTGELIRKLEGHTGWVRTVAFSPDGSRIVSGSADYRSEKDKRDNALRLWDAETGEEIRSFEDVDGPINRVVFTPDGRRVLVAGEWNTFGIWDAETGKLVRRFPKPTTHPESLAISPDGETAATGHASDNPPLDGQPYDDSNGCAACLWDLKTGRLIRKLRGHASPVNAVAFSPDGRYLLSGSGADHHHKGYSPGSDNSIRLWDVKTGNEIWKGEAKQSINSVAFLPDGRSVVSGGGTLATGGGDNKPDLRIWQLPVSVWPRD